jgi:hypothetical protein
LQMLHEVKNSPPHDLQKHCTNLKYYIENNRTGKNCQCKFMC